MTRQTREGVFYPSLKSDHFFVLRTFVAHSITLIYPVMEASYQSRSFCLSHENHQKYRKRGEAMLRAKKVYFRASPSDIDRLFACNRESARVWNHCLKLSRQYYHDHHKWISKSALQKATKGKVSSL
jgi:hypothetical protein